MSWIIPSVQETSARFIKLSWFGVGAGGGQKGFFPGLLVSISRFSTASDIILKLRAHATLTSSALLNRYKKKIVIIK